ncbi:TetR/AcrR family transcriptional regulator [Yoonia sp. R2331]|uniref:TetR/AcrR family transcriptional regulator n=1 Tax=Yoonia sp. R2331 TaxID=3237238 RepID=UPI0034E440CE
MARAPQQRRIDTHNRLLAAAKAIVADGSYAQMRVEEVVIRAGVAKGTFFAHFRDKDALMEALIAEDLTAAITAMREAPAPHDAATLVTALDPLVRVLASERAAFDLIMRYSGALEVANIGPIAQNFIDQIMLFIDWVVPLHGKALRGDIDPQLMAEGIQAFVVQTVALSFCAVESRVVGIDERLGPYLNAWLAPQPH